MWACQEPYRWWQHHQISRIWCRLPAFSQDGDQSSTSAQQTSSWFPTVKLTWDSGCGELGTSSSMKRPWASSFIKCSSLSLRWEALSFTVFLKFQPRANCLPKFFLLIVSALFLPQSWLTSLQVTLLQGIPMPLPKTGVLFAWYFFHCCSLLNTLKATSPNWEWFIPNASSSVCNILLILESLCPQFKKKCQIYHYNIFRGFRIYISMTVYRPDRSFTKIQRSLHLFG